MDRNGGNSDAVHREPAGTFWKVIRDQRKIIVAFTLLFGLIGFVLNFIVMRPVYESSASFLLTQLANQSSGYVQNNSLDLVTTSVPRVPPMSLKTHMGLAADEAVMRRVIDKLQLGEQGYSPKKLASAVRVSSAGENSGVIKVTARSEDPALSADIANTICSEYSVMLIDINKKLINSSVQMMIAETEALKAELAKAATNDEKTRITDTLAALSGKIYNARVARDIDLGSTSVVLISPAMSSADPVISGKILYTALAILMGLAGSALLAFFIVMRRGANQVGPLADGEVQDNQGSEGKIKLSGWSY